MDSRPHAITRRDALAMTSAAFLASCGTAPRSAQFPKGAIIRTLLNDAPPESFAGGAVLFHEHLSMKYPPQAQTHFTDDIDLMIAEVRAAGKDGISCIVDGGHADMSRNLDALKRIARESGVGIVASGGYYMQRTYPPEIAAKSAEQLADELAREALANRFGAFGEIGQQFDLLTDDEKKVFRAVAMAHVRTGLPIFTHNAYTGTRQVQTPIPMDAALRQIDVLEAAGANLKHVAIGHVCCLDDPKATVAQQIVQRGAFIGFDRVTIQTIISDEKRAAMLLALVDAGYASQILIASDFAVGASLKARGGPGIAQAWTVFGPLLIKAGLPEATLRGIMIDNPRRFLAFVPV